MLDNWARDREAHSLDSNSHIQLVAEWDDCGRPTKFTTWDKFKAWFFSSRGFGFQSSSAAEVALSYHI